MCEFADSIRQERDLSEEEAFNRLVLLSPNYSFSFGRDAWFFADVPGNFQRKVEYKVFTFGPDDVCRLFTADTFRGAVEKAENLLRVSQTINFTNIEDVPVTARGLL